MIEKLLKNHIKIDYKIKLYQFLILRNYPIIKKKII